MKLDWKRGQYASIVDCGKYTASTWRDPACGGWNFSVYGNAGAVVLKKISDTCGSMEGAEKLAEAWLEQHTAPSGTTSLQMGRGMKLDWKTEGTASICCCNGITCVVHFAGDGYSCSVCRSAIPAGNGLVVEGTSGLGTMASAWAWCEREVEKHDRPEWHDVTDWLSWAEWRGWKMAICPTALLPGDFTWIASTDVSFAESGQNFNKKEPAKLAAEKWVREQGEKA